MTTVPAPTPQVRVAANQLSDLAESLAGACDQMLASVMAELSDRFSATSLVVTPDSYGEPYVELTVVIDGESQPLFEIDGELSRLAEAAVLTTVNLTTVETALRTSTPTDYFPNRTIYPAS
jgi:hypothetical protein